MYSEKALLECLRLTRIQKVFISCLDAFNSFPVGILTSISTVQPEKQPSQQLLCLCVKSFKGPTCHQETPHFLSLTYKALPPWSLANLPKLISHHEPPGIPRLFPLSPLSGQLLLIFRCQLNCTFPPNLTPQAGSGALVLCPPPPAPFVPPAQLYQTV